MDSYRTFIAVELPRDLRALILQRIKTLRDELPDVRASWSREDNLHLTLKFLGNVPAGEISKVSDAVARAASTISQFELAVSGSGAFPPHGRPNVLWIGVGTHASGVPSSASPLPLSPCPLAVLHSAIEDECARDGFPREQRPFHPHLTIARFRKFRGDRRLSELHKSLGFTPRPFAVSEVVVFRSQLLRDGSKHTAISRHQLAN